MLRRLIPILLLAGVGGCAAAPRPDVEACVARLAERSVAFQRLDDFGQQGDCGVQAGLKLSGSTVAWSRDGIVTCAMAESMIAFEAETLQPLALQLFRQPVAKLHHMGTYSCRGRNGKTFGRLSEHAFGRAIDIRSFELADGTVIDVGRHWSRAGKKSEFLRGLARRACDRFAVVLTPNHDHAHRDHLHLDVGSHRLCGT